MKIQELAQQTNLTKGEIIFLRKEDLLKQKEDYEAQDVDTIKKIQLMRKLEVAHKDILWMQKGILQLNQCLEQQLQKLQEKDSSKTSSWVSIAKEIIEKDTNYNLIDANYYLSKINRLEKGGGKFGSLKGDFLTRIKATIPPNSEKWFEPDEPIINCHDFTVELCKYAEKNKEQLTILKEGMEPTVEINGERYLCMLESPRMLKFPWSIFFATSSSFGFKFVYMYRYMG